MANGQEWELEDWRIRGGSSSMSDDVIRQIFKVSGTANAFTFTSVG